MKRSILSILVFFTLAVSYSYSQISPELQAKWDKENAVHENPLLENRPNKLPDRVLITPLSSNNDELTFTWRTDTTITKGRLEIIQGDAYSFPDKNKKVTDSYHQVIKSKDFSMHYHKAVVKGLQPDKIYKYRVGDSPNWSPWFTYKHNNFKDTVSLLYFGDVQNGIYRHTTKIFKEAVEKFENSKLAIFTGDIIAHANNDYEWAEWHAATHDVKTTIPVIATPGNHEYSRDLERNKTLSDYWKTTFSYPYIYEMGNYYLDYGFVRFVVLNSNEDAKKQGIWLDSLLSQTKQDWVIIATHYPIYSGAKGRANTWLQEQWLPIYEKYKHKIGIVLQGHDHTYARGGLLNRTGTPSRPSSPVFVMSFVGEKRYELAKQDWMDVAYPDISTYQYIEITKNKISYKSFSETNTLIDQFEIVK